MQLYGGSGHLVEMDSEERLYYTERELLKAFKFPGKKEKALQLLREVPDPKKILDPDGQCLLHFACDRNWKGVVELLLTKYNFDPHFEDEFGGTALRDACAQGYTELARYLMEEWCVDPTKKDKSGKSPLDECKNWNKFETQMCIESIIGQCCRQILYNSRYIIACIILAFLY